MRQHFLNALSQAGFSTDESLVTADIQSRMEEFCPDTTASVVDYYILGAHDVFGIPQDGVGNYLEGYGRHPLMTPAASVKLAFAELIVSCKNISDDRDAIEVFGGSDDSYASSSRKNTILSRYNNFASKNCL